MIPGNKKKIKFASSAEESKIEDIATTARVLEDPGPSGKPVVLEDRVAGGSSAGLSVDSPVSGALALEETYSTN